MEGDRKTHLSEGVPLNSGAANIFLNTGKKAKSNDGTVIHLNTEKPSDVGVHINTTLSIASSKKIKLLFVLNLLLSVVCVFVSGYIAFYYWNEMVSIRRQLDILRDQILIQNIREGVLHQEKPVQSPLLANLRPRDKDGRESRELIGDPISPNARKYYVEDLGEDMVFVDSSKKKSSQDKVPVYDLSVFQKEPMVAHFNGGINERQMGTDSNIGPWVHDRSTSTKGSETKIQVNSNYFTVKESGLYLLYAQIVYISYAPNCFFIWAWQPQEAPRQVTMCATADTSPNSVPLSKAQMSCSVHVVVRLARDETIRFTQREENRTVWLKPGFSYIGFIKLSS
ncbi:uncharacterized protein LOC121730748 [Aricia agestis]|uniref:uncharacterized protein LOC121730748 n=1 Tax=Aricia agestis TaxID=91739 RepID=UPI001C20C450|nr:uncharacterized protein LOC121730748 [Aricia agestis]XP_041975840.1 uncharacterized protein LOC121730748 [Aricia agestis]XP_041975841.1 uncharacterized protein LOC121730748 [Aricia agestis]